jgi:hypothetical protein
MSYCRFSEADAYIFSNGDGYYECQWCRLKPLPPRDLGGGHTLGLGFDSHWVKTAAEMLAHVAEHRAAGHRIPESVDEELRSEELEAAR